MAEQKLSQCKKCIFTKRRYWYHISTTLKYKEILLKPWDNARSLMSKASNRDYSEPDTERICVAPSMAHCLTAVPYCPGDTYHIYRTKSRIKANKPEDVFDSNITQEAWIQKPTVFVNIGTLRLMDVEDGKRVQNLIDQAASQNNPQQSGKVLKWWKKRNLWKYLKRS